MTEINIPDSVQMIEGFAFENMVNLEKIEVDKANENYTSEDGVLFNKNKTSLELYPQGKKDIVYTVPNTVITIKSYSICEFARSLEKFIVLDNVTEISKDVCTFMIHYNVTIYGYEGSVIQEYANIHKINFVAINDKNFKITVNVDKTSLKTGEEFEAQVNINELNNIENGIIAFSGNLEYDSNVLEMIKMESQNDWDQNEYNENNFKFVTTNNKFITEDSTIFKIKFKVKDTITENTTTRVKIKDIVASNGKNEIESEDAELEVNITMPEEITITSEKYNIQQEEKIITKILPNTTLKDFIANISTNTNIVVTDKDGNVLSEDNIIGTGMKLKAENLELTLVITADLNGDGRVTITDLAKLKLHYIESEELTGVYLNAADIDENNKIGINDIAQIKLVLIGLMVLD